MSESGRKQLFSLSYRNILVAIQQFGIMMQKVEQLNGDLIAPLFNLIFFIQSDNK